MMEAFEDLREIHGSMGWQVLRVGAGEFTVLDETVPVVGGDLAHFRDALEGALILEIRLQDVLEPEVLEDIFRRIHPSAVQGPVSSPERFRGLEEAVGLSFKESSSPLRGMAGSIQDLFDPREDGGAEDVPEQSPEPTASEVDAPPAAAPPADTPSADTPPDVATPPGPQLLPDLEEKVQGFFSAAPGERAELGEAILAVAASLKEERAMASVAHLVEALATPRGEGPDSEALELASQIITPAIASHLVIRLGEMRDEEERAHMIRLSSGLGREMALALADALGEARDRYQRRSFMDAMLAHGPLALEVAKGMVEDPRWFVVRNGVSLMGEIGGESAVSDLTGTLANQDSRVRRETVLALAKLGGSDAEQLLLGMLDEKALKPLMKILEDDQDEDVQVECLQALGKIEDPGAVLLIEKRAVGSLFSRPSKEIRVAAYRALAGIGTPHAMSLLEKAATDSDVAVRTVVQALLD